MKQLRVDSLRYSHEDEGTGFMIPFYDSRILLNLRQSARWSSMIPLERYGLVFVFVREIRIELGGYLRCREKVLEVQKSVTGEF